MVTQFHRGVHPDPKQLHTCVCYKSTVTRYKATCPVPAIGAVLQRECNTLLKAWHLQLKKNRITKN